MQRDPIIEEIRRVRHDIEAECQNDPQEFYKHIQQLQDKYLNRLVRREPRKLFKKRAVG
jgi:hypothetical protein